MCKANTKIVNLAILGGSTAYHLLRRGAFTVLDVAAVATPFGEVPAVQKIELSGDVHAWFLSRHGQERYSVSAPFVNYRAQIYALKSLGAERVISWSGPGAIRGDKYRPGDFVIPHDIIDETRRRASTFFEGKGWGFIRSHPTFCPQLGRALRDAFQTLDIPVKEGGVYVCTEGPRLETAAEIRKYEALGGDLVGMTLSPEAFLARELEICYAPLCYVTNFAEGVVDRPVRPGELFGGMMDQTEREAVARCTDLFPSIVREALAGVASSPRDCHCGDAMLRYRREGVLGDDWRGWL